MGPPVRGRLLVANEICTARRQDLVISFNLVYSNLDLNGKAFEISVHAWLVESFGGSMEVTIYYLHGFPRNHRACDV